MVLSLKELTLEEKLAPGHRLCPGCGPAMAARMALKGETETQPRQLDFDRGVAPRGNLAAHRFL